MEFSGTAQPIFLQRRWGALAKRLCIASLHIILYIRGKSTRSVPVLQNRPPVMPGLPLFHFLPHTSDSVGRLRSRSALYPFWETKPTVGNNEALTANTDYCKKLLLYSAAFWLQSLNGRTGIATIGQATGTINGTPTAEPQWFFYQYLPKETACERIPASCASRRTA